VKVDHKMMHTGGNDAIPKIALSKSSPFKVKMLVEYIRRGFSVILNAIVQILELKKGKIIFHQNIL
jgi:hypothetical protein